MNKCSKKNWLIILAGHRVSGPFIPACKGGGSTLKVAIGGGGGEGGGAEVYVTSED